MQDSDRRPILKSMSDFYVTDICILDLCPLFKFSNWRPMTSLAYASNYVKPVRSGFRSNDGEPTRPDSR